MRTKKSFLVQEVLKVLCNMYRGRVQTLCNDPTKPPVIIHKLSLALGYLAKNVSEEDAKRTFFELASLFTGLGLQLADQVYPSQDSLIPRKQASHLPRTLYFLIKPLHHATKKLVQRCTNFEFSLSTEIAARFFNVWLYVFLYRQFSGCPSAEEPVVYEEEVKATMQKFAFRTPPLVFHCGTSIWSYMKYEPCLQRLGNVAADFFGTALQNLVSKKSARSTSKEEYIYAYAAYSVSMLQIPCLQHKLRKNLLRSADKQHAKKSCVESMLLPTFFAYLFDSGIQHVSSLLELFNAINSNLFYDYFNTLNAVHASSLRQHLITEDTIFLLKASCNLYANVRKQSTTYLREYCDRFPFLLTLPSILFTLLDIIGSLYNELYLPYDSLSHILYLPHSNQTLILPVDKAKKQDAFRFLIKLCEEMYIKATLVNEAELIAVYQEYVHKTISAQPIDSLAHFGLSFFQNLYANYKYYESELHPFDHIENLDSFNRSVQSLIAKSKEYVIVESLTNTVNELIEKSAKIRSSETAL